MPSTPPSPRCRRTPTASGSSPSAGRSARGRWPSRRRTPLLYGGPVPGYAAPGEQTTGPGTRVARAMVGILADAHAAGVVADPDDPAPGQALAAGLADVRAQLDAAVPDRLLVRGVLAFTSVFGIVSFEVFGQFGPDGLGDAEELFERHLASLADQLGLPPIRP
ncbi:TetR-like C-terminal domain-containing protein [Nocardioides sp. TF02-7]|uniref:TetR-like C-terminal domain-containing protein n=1 Tax=Nocardioides sp. TF02-7 TaxID=2917724 RepID=UPI001F05E266|nr:TetR-like C-terminal domain-containing protein [Nocardioides sp. TF02-7]UMG93248.1 WHG domain-containing protein [Nocardioides sp. TF02-7]